jgi:4-amino-4-deoxy-L-arabinose transferase-like glycosyltransferase
VNREQWTEGLAARSERQQELLTLFNGRRAGEPRSERMIASEVVAEKAGPDSYPKPVLWGVVLALLLAAWALRLYRLGFQDIWWDEARNIDVASRAIGQIAASPQLDIQPPSYLYGLHLWMAVAGQQAFATRFLSACFGLVAMALSYRLARELLPGRRGQLAGVLALLLAGVSAYGLAEAQETRMYTLSWALLAAAMLAMWRAVAAYGRAWRRQAGWWTLFALLVAISLTTHYSTAIVLATWALWLLIWALRGPGRWKRLATLASVALGTAVLLLPAVPIALRQIPGYDNPNLNLPDLQAYLAQLYRAFTMGEFVPDRLWGISRWLWLLLPVGGVAAALLARSGGMTTTRWNRLASLLLWLVGGLALYYGILLSRPAFNPRYISLVLPALWAVAGWTLAQWEAVARPLPWIAAGALVVLTVPSLHADLADPQNFREDTRGVVRWIEERAGPDDVVLVDQAYPFGVYWPRWNEDPEAPLAAGAAEPPAYYLAVDVNRIGEQLRDLAGQARQVFWVNWFESDTDPKGVVRDLLDANGIPLGSQDFRGYNVSWWQLGPARDFALPNSYQAIQWGFEPGITLLEGDWFGRTTPADKTHPALVALRWQADHATTQPLKVSLRLKDAAGATVAQNDRLLLSDRHLRTDAWQPGETTLAIYSLPLADAPPGTYDLALVVYDEATLAPVGLADNSGVEAIIGKLRIR